MFANDGICVLVSIFLFCLLRYPMDYSVVKSILRQVRITFPWFY